MKTRSIRTSLAVVALCAGISVPARAEVSTDPLPRHRSQTLLMDHTFLGITDGADPIPAVRWQTYRELPAGRQLNRSGALRPDGRPDVVYRLPTAAPLVVWAYNNGADEHDIAFAAWEDDRWGATHFLTSTAGLDEADPRVFYGLDGTIRVVWTVQPVGGGESRIFLATRSPAVVLTDGTVATEPLWTDPERVSLPGEIVGRPTVAESHGQLWVAYERYLADDAAAPTQIVVRHRALQDSPGTFAAVDVINTNRVGALSPLLTAMHGRLWLDWQQGFDRFGFVTFRSADLGWSPVQAIPLPNPSWEGIEDARQTIRRLVISRTSVTVEIASPAN